MIAFLEILPKEVEYYLSISLIKDFIQLLFTLIEGRLLNA